MINNVKRKWRNQVNMINVFGVINNLYKGVKPRDVLVSVGNPIYIVLIVLLKEPVKIMKILYNVKY